MAGRNIARRAGACFVSWAVKIQSSNRLPIPQFCGMGAISTLPQQSELVLDRQRPLFHEHSSSNVASR